MVNVPSITTGCMRVDATQGILNKALSATTSQRMLHPAISSANRPNVLIREVLPSLITSTTSKAIAFPIARSQSSQAKSQSLSKRASGACPTATRAAPTTLARRTASTPTTLTKTAEESFLSNNVASQQSVSCLYPILAILKTPLVVKKQTFLPF